ncbi:MAG: hypothetical protein JXA00_03005, partial [Candidatus Thermoplasmatota archaeon]|nr:hypothetical protein [Candidatus Thermoplasmatota archaeon]
LCIDCFRTTTPLSHFLSISNRLFCTAWGLPSLSSLADFQNALHTEGFHDITTKDLSKNVQLSILREDVLSIPYLLPLIIRKLIKAKHYSLQDDPSFFTTAALQITLLGLAHKITYNAVTAKKRK